MTSAVATPMTSAGTSADLEARIRAACLRCVERWGITKTSLEDVAREAGCSRATVYRLFPGGKDNLIHAVATAEASTFFAALSDELRGAATLEDRLVSGVGYALRRLTGHPAVQALLTYTPDAPAATHGAPSMNGLVAPSTVFTAAHLSPWFERSNAYEAAERVVRIVLSFASCPSDHVDPNDEASIRRLVETFVMPGITALARADATIRSAPTTQESTDVPTTTAPTTNHQLHDKRGPQ